MADNRYLIALALPQCNGLGLPYLNSAEPDVSRMTAWLTQKHGYVRVLEKELGPASTAPEIRGALSRWFGDATRKEEDTVLIYIAAHGGQLGRTRGHFIFTATSNGAQPDDTAIETARLATYIFGGENARPQNVMLILDTCYAGAGAAEVAAIISEAKTELTTGRGCGFWIVASAGATSGAHDGAFVTALLAAAETDECSPCGGATHIDPITLVVEITKWLPLNKFPQVADIDVVGAGRRRQQFLRNARFTRERDGRALQDESHWSPKARGVDEFSSGGWFFTGRECAVRELVAWLGAPESDSRARVVTGRPGSGKSALLGWIVLWANPTSRQEMEQQSIGPGAIAGLRHVVVDAAIHARGASYDVFLERLAAALAVPLADPVAMIRALSARPQPVRIVVDALDEASDAHRIERELLLPLAVCPAVRLIVGGRKRGEVAPLAGSAKVLDLDGPDYFEQADLAAYVAARLLRAASSPYPLARHEDARRVAAHVAEAARFSFLYARMLARRLAEQPAIDTTTANWRDSIVLPADLTAAFGADLERFPEATRRKVVALLLPLAYAQGRGLPQKQIWPRIASRLAGGGETKFSNADLRELKEIAGFYLIQDTEFGEVVFRLFHQAFADYLTDLSRDEDVERRISETLWELDPTPTGSWLQRREPYVTHFLAVHAANAGILEHLIRQPRFLLHASEDLLLPQLVKINRGEAGAVARAYRNAAVWLRRSGPDDRVAYLAKCLLEEGAGETFAQLTAAYGGGKWIPRWARWTPLTPSHAIAKGASDVTFVDVAMWDADPIVLVGRKNGGVEVWDLDRDACLFRWQPEEGEWAQKIAFVPGVNGPLLVVAWGDGLLGRFDLARNEGQVVTASPNSSSRRREFQVSPGAIGALWAGEILGERILVTATRDCRLIVRNLDTLAIMRELTEVCRASTYQLHFAQLAGDWFVIAAGDTVRETEQVDVSLRMWAYPSFAPIPFEQAPTGGCIQFVQAIEVAGRPAFVVSQDGWGPVEIWDLKNRRRVFQLEEEQCTRAWFLTLSQGGLLLTTWAGRGILTWRRLDLEAGPDCVVCHAQPKMNEVEIFESRNAAILPLNGEHLLLSAAKESVRVYSVEELLAMKTVDDANGSRFADRTQLMACVRGDELIEVGPGGKFAATRIETGAPDRFACQFESRPRLSCVAAILHRGATWIVGGDHEGNLHVLEAETKEEKTIPTGGRRVQSVALAAMSTDVLIFATVEIDSCWAVRVRSLTSGDDRTPQHPRGQPWALSLGEEDKTLHGLTVLAGDRGIRFAFSSKYGKVMVADYGRLPNEGRAWHDWFEEWFVSPREEGYILNLASLETAQRRWLAAASDRGTLMLWDFDTGDELASRPEAHNSSITTVALHDVRGRVVLASGGKDGGVKLWGPGLTLIMSLEFAVPVHQVIWLNADRLGIRTLSGTMVVDLDWKKIERERAFLGAS